MDQCILHAVLSNAQHPEYGEVSMPLPIKATEYGHCMELLSSLGIGDALSKDCQVAELIRAYPTLRCLEGSKVNIDELDYLAKRLDGFDAVEVSQFQANFSHSGRSKRVLVKTSCTITASGKAALIFRICRSILCFGFEVRQ